MRRSHLDAAGLAAAALLLSAADASAHGFAGNRFFPATLQIDDPNVADELSLPTLVLNPPSSDSPSVEEFDVSAEFSKRITENFGFSISPAWSRFSAKGMPTVSGWQNLEFTPKYKVYVNEPHEFMLSVGVETEIGGTGSKSIGADRVSTLTPTVYFGKGLGDLPDSWDWVRPFAVTGVIGYGIPWRATNTTDGEPTTRPNTLEWGFTLQYSIPYLQGYVRDLGIGAPFNRLIPVVEFNMETALNRGGNGQTTGTISPGLIWVGQYYQIGAEMIVPVNGATGHGVGGILQLHFYLDDIFPQSIGKPIFGN
ncbi:MAG TPA: hypothetical protein VMU06_05765 [Stellaceae bacterium]|nr:hypothetical protein [Stellaceae bacterium]